ncbi:MAG: DegT/DnrJ/EryC1/StrS family aminotransferase [Chitinophagaceae bacterium]|nr:DegT/DnrJ/EryC1/StrS family aminotransferase [Chitinophagaceae bacterium]
MIPVTKTFLPPIEDYITQLKRAWDNGWVTNRGELVKELEIKLREYLEVKNIILTANGTIPMQIALKTLGITGEVITTPFSYVATTAVIVWEQCAPVFVDIDPIYLTIDETKIEEAITPRTQAILATHVYGNPCNIDAIETIAKKHNLRVIYDAAHCFGVTYKGKSIFEYGDVSTCSFHATKIFHTGEGGAIFCNDDSLFHQLYFHHNFGHKNFEEFFGLGINAKMSELQAAMGLSIIPYIEKIKIDRRIVSEYYLGALKNSYSGFLKIRDNAEWNYSYFPLVLESEHQLLHIQEVMNKNSIFPRRYFYPSLNSLPYLTYSKMPYAEDISKRVICLPLYHDMKNEDLEKICNILIDEF